MKIRRVATFFLAIVLLFVAFTSAFGAAAATDTKGHWAEVQLNDWMQQGLISGYGDGSVKPDREITRAEFMALINRAFHFTARAEVHFKDLKASDWAYHDVQIAIKAGYVQGYDDQTIRWGNKISRQEAASIVYRLQKLQGDSGAAAALADSASFPSWSKEVIGAVVGNRIMSGYADGSFRPERPITRAEAIVTLQRIIGVVYDKEGTYGPDTGTETIAGNVTITAPGVTLRNMEITGNLRIAASVGDGDAYLDHVTVQGATFVNGGGENSIHIDFSTLINVFAEVYTSQYGSVRLEVVGSTIQIINVTTPVIIQQRDVPNSPVLGGIQTVNMNAPTKIFVQGGQIQVVNVGSNAGGSTVSLENGANVKEMEVGAPVHVVGNGTIDKAILYTSPDGILFEIQPGSTLLAPSTPTITMARSNGDREAIIHFTQPQEQSFITGYTVTTYPGGQTTDLVQNIVKNLKPGEDYRFTIRAKNVAGMTSADSNLSNTVTMSGSSPVSATTNIEGTIVTIKFNKPVASPRGYEKQFIVEVDRYTNKKTIMVEEAVLNGASQIDLQLKEPVKAGQEVMVSYSYSKSLGEAQYLAKDAFPIIPFSLPVTIPVAKPKFVSATTDEAGSRVSVTFDKPMTNPAGSHGSFKVNVNGKSVFVSAAALNAAQNKIDLTLGAPVTKGQTVTVAYTAGMVTSADKGQLASFAAQNVTNAVTVESPAFLSAETNAAGTIVTVTFNKPLADPTGMQSQFAVNVNGRPNLLKAAALNGANKIDLTLATAVKAGDTVTIAYVYAAGKVAAADKGVLASFTDQPVANMVRAPQPPTPSEPAVITAPAFVSATTNTAGTIVTVTFDKPMADPAGKHSQFTVQANGTAKIVTAAALNNNTNKIDLTLATAVTAGQTVTVAYTAGTITAVDTGVLATFAAQNVTNAAPAMAPTFVSATTNTAGTIVTVTFDKPMADPAGKHSQFTVQANGAANAVTAAALNGNTNKINLTLATPVTVGQTVTVAYTAGTIAAADTGVLATFAAKNVTNAVMTPGAAPVFVSATTNAAGTIVTVTFNKAMADPADKKSYFKVYVDNFYPTANVALTAAALNNDTTKIDLTLAAPITSGQQVKVAFLQHSPDEMTAADGGILASFSYQTVTNAVSAAPDTTPPALSLAFRNSDTQITVILDEVAAAATVTKSNDGGFTVRDKANPGIQYTVSKIAPGGTPDQVVLTVSNLSASSSVGVTVTYTAGGNGTVTDAAGNAMVTDTIGKSITAWT
ncbi:SwmB domain-containing protein [Cohnella soli]|uniref:SwmB domain-containing protein n=1 Tax=Cohnella soli TaxID=425005 RepID=A0ABW0HWC1_9BACL